MSNECLKQMIVNRQIKLKVLVGKCPALNMGEIIPVFNRKGIYSINQEICWVEDGNGGAWQVSWFWFNSKFNDVKDSLNPRVNTPVQDLYDLYKTSQRHSHKDYYKRVYGERLRTRKMEVFSRALDHNVNQVFQVIETLK